LCPPVLDNAVDLRVAGHQIVTECGLFATGGGASGAPQYYAPRGASGAPQYYAYDGGRQAHHSTMHMTGGVRRTTALRTGVLERVEGGHGVPEAAHRMHHGHCAVGHGVQLVQACTGKGGDEV